MTYLFDDIYVITLQRVDHKKERIQKHLDSLNIPFKFHLGLDGNIQCSDEFIAQFTLPPDKNRMGSPERKPMKKGEYGCLMSHIDVITRAKKEGLKGVLILEDDVVLSEDFWERMKILENEWPEDCDIMMLGGIVYSLKLPKKSRVSEHVWQISKSWIQFGAHAYIVKEKAYDKLIESWESMANIADVQMTDTCKDGILNGYMIWPYPSYQLPGKSEIEKKYRGMDYSKLLYSDTPNLSDCPAINEKGEINRKGTWAAKLF